MAPAAPRGSFVLYWMHNALRGHDNPALDAAILLAQQNRLPLLVYQGLCESHPYASDRHHAFVLQGARDVQRELADRGIRFVFHLQRRAARGPHLKTLARQAAIVVTEETPVEPMLGWSERLRAATTTPIVSVDASCVVPMPMVEPLCTDVAEFRRRTEGWFAERVDQVWEDEPVTCAPYTGSLPFEPLDLQDVDLARLVGECRIDHTVPPVIDSPGGTRAGYARWEAFCREGLADYSPQRNEATWRGTSRISPYLHYGMVSPFRLARDAHRAGAEAFLERLLYWRELAHHYCFHIRDALETFDAIPKWARQTLTAHADDARTAEVSWETLARAHSGDIVWDVCQRSLLKHGELHPSARRLWGKSLLRSTQEPRHALQLASDLNHRYALDGRDPNSYGGLLWCFGQFDRPSQQETPVYGRVRPPDLDAAPRGDELSRFSEWVDRPIANPLPKVAVVGAGVAGLIAARALSDYGIGVTVFDLARSPGGRVSTCHAASGAPFDDGAQYFTVRDDRLARWVRSWMQQGVVAPWTGRIVELRHGRAGSLHSDVPRYVGVPAMQTLADHLASGLQLVTQTRVAPISRQPVSGQPGQWQLHSEDGRELGQFDVVIASCPPPEAARLLAVEPALVRAINSVPISPCWSVMIQPEQPLGLEYDAAFVHESPLDWIARNNSKPQRGASETWVLHASGEWSQKHVQEPCDEVLAKLLAAFTAATGAHVSNPVAIAARRWDVAKPLRTLDEPCLWDPTAAVGACGDWCGGAKVEGALLSGAAMAGCVMRQLTIDRKVGSR